MRLVLCTQLNNKPTYVLAERDSKFNTGLNRLSVSQGYIKLTQHANFAFWDYTFDYIRIHFVYNEHRHVETSHTRMRHYLAYSRYENPGQCLA